MSSTEGNIVARKNPLDRIAAKAADSIKDPKGTADKVYAQAKGASAAARHLAGAFGQFAMTKATETAGTFAERAAARLGGRSRPGLRPVPDVNEPAAPVPPERFEKPAAPPAPPAPTEPTAQETPASPAASAAPATPADVARAVKRNGGAATTAADTGPGDKLPPPRKAQAGDQTAKKAGAKGTGSSSQQGAGTSTAGEKAAGKKAASKQAAGKKAAGKKAASKKATGSATKSSGSSTGKKAAGGSTAKKQPPPSSNG